MQESRKDFARLLELCPWLADAVDGAGEGILPNAGGSACARLAAIADLASIDRLGATAEFQTLRDIAQRDRLLSGVRRWSQWARDMLALKREAPASRAVFHALWRAAAHTRFDAESARRVRLGEASDMAGLQFPGGLEITDRQASEFVDLSGVWVGGGLTVARCVFAAGSSWSQTWAQDASSFTDTVFGGRTDFGATTWRQPVSFGGCEFRGAAMFREASFLAGVAFRDTRFESDLGFHVVRCDGPSAFVDCVVKGAASFQSSRFAVPTVVENAVFAGPLHADRETGEGFRTVKSVEAAEAAAPAGAKAQRRSGRARRDGAA